MYSWLKSTGGNVKVEYIHTVNVMIISHKYKFIFIKTFKTAGTSIEIFLSEHCGDNDIVTTIEPYVEPHVARNYSGKFNPISDLLYFHSRGLLNINNIKLVMKHWLQGQKFYNHLPGTLVKQRIPDEIWNDYFKFCVVRNPWDLTLSHYYYRTRGKSSFESYIRKGNFRNNYHMYTDVEGNLILDKVLIFESLEDDLDKVLGYLSIPFVGSLDVKAKATSRKDRRPYQEIYSKEQRQIIEKEFQNEIKMHDYSF
jgi:hypothetical protein